MLCWRVQSECDANAKEMYVGKLLKVVSFSMGLESIGYM